MRGQWPRVQAIFLRTMFRRSVLSLFRISNLMNTHATPPACLYACSTYKGIFMGNTAMYKQYNDAMHSLARLHRDTKLQAKPTPSPSVMCPMIAVLDLPSIMNYSDSTGLCVGGKPSGQGTCSSLSGWTEDGLHPARWVLAQFLNMCLNVLSDCTGACPVETP